MGKLVRSDTLHGPMLSLPGDQYVGRSLELYGECSERELELLVQLVKPGSTVVEAGANIGTHTIPLARACAPGRLYAFEPQQRIFQILCANLVENGVENVIAMPEACGATSGYASIPLLDYDAPQNFGSLSLLRAGDIPKSGVRVTRIDDLGLRTCALIKADVEGFEADVLAGARLTIKAHRPILYVENNVSEKQQQVLSIIHDLGYRQWWHTPPMYRPENYKSNPDDVFRGIVSLNILAIPNERGGGPEGPPINIQNWTSPVKAMPISDLIDGALPS